MPDSMMLGEAERMVVGTASLMLFETQEEVVVVCRLPCSLSRMALTSAEEVASSSSLEDLVLVVLHQEWAAQNFPEVEVVHRELEAPYSWADEVLKAVMSLSLNVHRPRQYRSLHLFFLALACLQRRGLQVVVLPQPHHRRHLLCPDHCCSSLCSRHLGLGGQGPSAPSCQELVVRRPQEVLRRRHLIYCPLWVRIDRS